MNTRKEFFFFFFRERRDAVNCCAWGRRGFGLGWAGDGGLMRQTLRGALAQDERSVAEVVASRRTRVAFFFFFRIPPPYHHRIMYLYV